MPKRAAKAHLKKALPWVLALVTVCALGVYGWSRWEDVSAVGSIRWHFLLYIILLRAALMIISGLQNKLFYGHFEVKLVFSEWFGLTVINSMASYMIPLHGGVAATGVYLKRVHNLSYARFASVVLASRLFGLFVSGIIGIVVSGLLLAADRGLHPWLLGFPLTIALGILCILLIRPRLPNRDSRFFRILRDGVQGWNELRGDRPLLTKAALLIVSSIAGQWIMLLLAYEALSVETDLLPVLMLTVYAQFTILLRITPGNLGLQEALIAFISEAVGIGFDAGLAVAAIVRGVSLALIFGLGGLYTYILTHRLAATPEDRASASLPEDLQK